MAGPYQAYKSNAGQIFQQALGNYFQLKQGERDEDRFKMQQQQQEMLMGQQKQKQAAQALAQKETLTPEEWQQYRAMDPEGAQKKLQWMRENEDYKLGAKADFAKTLKGKDIPDMVGMVLKKAQDLRKQGNTSMANDYDELAKQLSDPNTQERAKNAILGTPELAYGKNLRKRPPAEKLPKSDKFTKAGLVPGSAEYIAAAEADLEKKPLVKVYTGEKAQDEGMIAEQRAMGTQRAGYAGEVQKAGDDARDQLNQIEIMNSIDITTGKWEPAKVEFAAALAGLGIDVKDSFANVSGAESYVAAQQKFVNSILMAAKGIQTEGDANRAKQTVASLGKTPEANRFINGTVKAVVLRKIEKSDFYDDWKNDPANKGSTKGAEKAWRKHIREVPLISKNKKVNGLPIFFHDFKERVEAANPGIPREDVLKLWKSHDVAKKEKKIQVISQNLNTPVEFQSPGEKIGMR